MLKQKDKKFFIKYKQDYHDLQQTINSIKINYQGGTEALSDLLKRPEITISKLNNSGANKKIQNFSDDLLFSVETAIKYSGYEKRELDRIEKIKKLEGLKLPQNINYNIIKNLSSESKEKLAAVQPETLGQASRIAGVRPSDIAVLSIYLTSHTK